MGVVLVSEDLADQKRKAHGHQRVLDAERHRGRNEQDRLPCENEAGESQHDHDELDDRGPLHANLVVEPAHDELIGNASRGLGRDHRRAEGGPQSDLDHIAGNMLLDPAMVERRDAGEREKAPEGDGGDGGSRPHAALLPVGQLFVQSVAAIRLASDIGGAVPEQEAARQDDGKSRDPDEQVPRSPTGFGDDVVEDRGENRCGDARAGHDDAVNGSAPFHEPVPDHRRARQDEDARARRPD